MRLLPKLHVGPLYAYRAWRIRGDGLYSFSGWRAWPDDKPKVALCWRNFFPVNPHHAPGEGCTCGVYAWKEPPTTPHSPQGITPSWGVVELGGIVVVHQYGYRAQYATPVAIEKGLGVEEVARRYGLVVLDTLDDWKQGPR